MITKESNIKKYCCFYVSEYHLEMILLPYIKNNMDKSKIMIFTEDNLMDTIKILLEKINFAEDDKNKILNLDWQGKNDVEFLENDLNEYTFIINGKNDYINKINKKIENLTLKNVNIIHCFNINNKNQENLQLQGKYDGILNTKNIYT